MNTENNITIIFADDHELLRDGFQTLMATIPGIKLLAMAANGEELLQLVREHQPDVVITDIKMPLMKGEEVTRIIRKEFPQIRVIAFTAHDEVALITDMIKAGASGVLIKNASKQELITAIKNVNDGKEYYCSNTAMKMVKHQVEPLPAEVRITDRELEVLKLMCRGYSNKEIAGALDIHARTVEFHRANLYKKTGTGNLAHLSLYASQHGLI